MGSLRCVSHIVFELLRPRLLYSNAKRPPMTDKTLELDQHLCFALYGASMAIGRLYKPVLDEAGITIPFPQSTLSFREEAVPIPLKARVVKEREEARENN